MVILLILKLITAIFLVGFGIWTILQPEKFAEYSHYSVDTARGRAELRILGGGFFIGLGIGALLFGSLLADENIAYQVVGFAALGGGVTRLLNLVLEEPEQIVDRLFWIFLASEIIPGLILAAPM